jgi:hypothetical protein
MTSDEPTFKPFSSFGFDDLPVEAVISRRMLRRLEDIDDATTTVIALTETAQFCSSKVLTAWLRH